MLHIHGTSDNTNPYAGTSTMKGIEETVAFWVNKNNCSPTPTVNAVPDSNTSDNATATHYVYSGGIDGHSVELFKVTGGGHTWPGSPVVGINGNTCMDFDACKEIWRFFSQYSSTAALTPNERIEVDFWPNPTSAGIHIQASNDRAVTQVRVYDLRGRLLIEQNGTNIQYLDLEQLRAGKYMLQLMGEGFSVMKKMMVR